MKYTASWVNPRAIRTARSLSATDFMAGKGSRFYFTLQLKPVESDLLHEMTPDLSMDFTGKRVFVVEDNALNMEIACMLLDTFGIEVKEVYNGKEAVEDVRTTPPGYYDAGNGWTGGNANDQTA